MSRVTRLSARLPTTLLPPAAPVTLLARQPVRRWRLRRCDGILLPQTQLPFEIVYFLLAPGQLLPQLLNVTTKPLIPAL